MMWGAWCTSELLFVSKALFGIDAVVVGSPAHLLGVEEFVVLDTDLISFNMPGRYSPFGLTQRPTLSSGYGDIESMPRPLCIGVVMDLLGCIAY
jgi:hypothetical protein